MDSILTPSQAINYLDSSNKRILHGEATPYAAL
jgi:hypothetical protein